jgi:hypothetical protein
MKTLLSTAKRITTENKPKQSINLANNSAKSLLKILSNNAQLNINQQPDHFDTIKTTTYDYDFDDDYDDEDNNTEYDYDVYDENDSDVEDENINQGKNKIFFNKHIVVMIYFYCLSSSFLKIL